MFADRVRRAVAPLGDEQGSMVVALLAAIVASGLMMTITATAVTGHRSVRFDRDHIRAVQGADAGVEEVIAGLSNPDPLLRPTLPAGWLPADKTAGPATYNYRIDPWPGEAGAWQVKSRGTIGGETRNVSAIISQPKPFQLVAFADSHMVLRGGNGANSYNSSVWGTGEGNLGSNGTITLNGSVTADDAELHDWETNPDPTRCTSNGNTVCAGADQVAPKTDVASTEAMGFIDDAIAAYCPATPVAFTGTSLAASGTPYCFTTMNLTADFTVTGTGNAIVYLTNPGTTSTFAVANKAKVNCPLCTGTGGPRPDAARLQIFTKSVGPIRIGNHSHVAASIYAPRATCGGNPSNAGANFYGSMVCAIITNQGAWQFHYDDRLRDLGVGGWTVRRWAED